MKNKLSGTLLLLISIIWCLLVVPFAMTMLYSGLVPLFIMELSEITFKGLAEVALAILLGAISIIFGINLIKESIHYIRYGKRDHEQETLDNFKQAIKQKIEK